MADGLEELKKKGRGKARLLAVASGALALAFLIGDVCYLMTGALP